MTSISVEERVTSLEAQLARLESELQAKRDGVLMSRTFVGRTSPDFLDTMFGIHARSPHIEEVSRRIEAERETEDAEALREQTLGE
ncbi:MAG: hypothetical protein H7Y38_18100 [Armatimonadetes bacterium]|nr:hypothetical protein [Armatimonadota bacterium]